MSRNWTRESLWSLCGGCGERINNGEPKQEIRLTGVTRVRQRCRQCAEGPVPPDLPALVERRSVEDLAPMAPARVLATGVALPLDWKARQVREPGEDG